MLHHTQASWDDLPLQYRHSPYFTIDTDVISLPVSVPSIPSDELLEDDDEAEDANAPMDTNIPDNITDLPSAKKGPKSLKSLAVKCRETLALIQTATYLCQRGDALEQLNESLQESLSFINSNLYTDSGLCPEVVKEDKKTSKKRSAKQVDDRSDVSKESPSAKRQKTDVKISNRRRSLKLRKKKEPKDIPVPVGIQSVKPGDRLKTSSKTSDEQISGIWQLL